MVNEKMAMIASVLVVVTCAGVVMVARARICCDMEKVAMLFGMLPMAVLVVMARVLVVAGGWEEVVDADWQ